MRRSQEQIELVLQEACIQHKNTASMTAEIRNNSLHPQRSVDGRKESV